MRLWASVCPLLGQIPSPSLHIRITRGTLRTLQAGATNPESVAYNWAGEGWPAAAVENPAGGSLNPFQLQRARIRKAVPNRPGPGPRDMTVPGARTGLPASPPKAGLTPGRWPGRSPAPDSHRPHGSRKGKSDCQKPGWLLRPPSLLAAVTRSDKGQPSTPFHPGVRTALTGPLVKYPCSCYHRARPAESFRVPGGRRGGDSPAKPGQPG